MTIEEILELKENFEVELKKATGKDGKGELPNDFWETYSAMANSYGGTVFLGIKEKQDKSIQIFGIDNIEKVKKSLFDTLNNPKKVNKNLLTDKDVIEIEIEQKKILKILIPRAKREYKPIYIDGNILEGTFKRNFEGDYLCDKETVKRMISEQTDDSRDNRILTGFDFSDIDIDSLNAYRNMLSAHKPEHPYNEYDPKEFLRVIGGYAKNRETKEEGLTLAGLLMFGKLHTIREEIPNYLIDYQERPEAKTEYRWIDRITTDGTWSGNLFDFYRKVIKKLYSDLKVPFSLDGNIRQDNTLIHIALREALINTISHADYSGRVSLLIVKRPDMFGFRNPGLMRIPIESAINGGESDCRNRTIHQMFLLIGLGERAGSGLPKIFSGWSSQHWFKPLLYEKQEPEQTLLELRMINLFDDSVINNLIEIYGDRFKKLDDTKRVILATAYLEKIVNHSRLNEITDEHSHDISTILKQLVEDKFLNSDGIGRGKVYFLPTRSFNTPNDFTFESLDIKEQAPDISNQAPDISNQAPDISNQVPDISNQVPDIISNLKMLNSDEKRILENIAYEISVTSRIQDKSKLEKVILEICSEKYISLTVLSQLLNRSSDSLRKNYLNPMVKNGDLIRAYETKPNHPNQAYKIYKK